jgi:tRNA (cytidine/uridine-2'-O-)-methyltransferase
VHAQPAPASHTPGAVTQANALHIVLHSPQIPPNTGNVIRLAANTGSCLHLIEPLGFTLDHAKMRRAGLDYHEFAELHVHSDVSAFLKARPDQRVFAFSTRGKRRYDQVRYAPGDALMFGSETQGLPQALLDQLGPEHCLTLPMAPGGRSLNLSNAVAIAVFEAWRQLGFVGAR